MQKRKILIIDDEPSFTRLVKATLEATGKFLVSEDNEGTAAVELARELKPDVILLDVIMPQSDGGAIAYNISSDPALCKTPIIFLTAIISKEDAAVHKQLGGFPCLSKPIGTAELVATIEAVLSGGSPVPQRPSEE